VRTCRTDAGGETDAGGLWRNGRTIDAGGVADRTRGRTDERTDGRGPRARARAKTGDSTTIPAGTEGYSLVVCVSPSPHALTITPIHPKGRADTPNSKSKSLPARATDEVAELQWY